MSTVCEYRRKDSPFVWLKWNDLHSGKVRYENTKIRPESGDAQKKIRRRKHAIAGTLIDAQEAAGGEAWHLWVPQWLNTRYQNRKPSLIKYAGQWKILSLFLAEQEISSPRLFTREHAFEYIEWRQSQVKEKSKRSPGLNTALADVRTMGMILREARRREFCRDDVTKALGLQRDDPEEKPEYTDEQITLISEKLQKKPEWMRIAFHIAIQSGLRHQETQIRKKNVNFANGEISIPNPKGGRKRAFTHAGSDNLMAYLKDVFSDGRQVTWTLPKDVFPGLAWRAFFDEIGLEQPICFHCTRVTYVSRGERAGVPESVMCKQVNHADTLVHRIYSRVPNEERRRFANAVQLPALA
jgi:hypothetical protein